MPARIVVCDPEHDVAVLEVADLDGDVIGFDLAAEGDPAAVVGFPLDGPLTLTPARVVTGTRARPPGVAVERHLGNGR